MYVPKGTPFFAPGTYAIPVANQKHVQQFDWEKFFQDVERGLDIAVAIRTLLG
jgi:hypothetical protein